MRPAWLALAVLLVGLVSVPAAPGEALADANCPDAASSYAGGSGTEGDPWLIDDSTQFQRLRDDSVAGWDDYFLITDDISMGGCTWTQTIGQASRPFTGRLDGGGNIVADLDIEVYSDINRQFVGLVGLLGDGGTITRLGFTGHVSGTNTGSSSNFIHAGGLVGGTGLNATVSYSFATGNVVSLGVDSADAGGLDGLAGGTVHDSYATGTSAVVGGTVAFAAGFGGYMGPGSTMRRNYSTGRPLTPSVTDYVGGFTGMRQGGTFEANFWDMDTSQMSSAYPPGITGVGVDGKTTAQMKSYATFSHAGWPIVDGWAPFSIDDDRIWGICEGITYPFLLWQYTYTTRPCAGTPPPPIVISITASLTTAAINVNSDDSGGSAITEIEYAVDDTSSVSGSSTDLSGPLELSGLAPGTSYRVFVRAVNAIGFGQWSTATAFTTQTPPAPPLPTPAGAPRDVVATAGDGSLVAAWRPPASEGSYPVTQYKATTNPGGRTCLTAATTCTIEGLTNGVSYSVTVQALTGAGWSPSSTASNTVVPRPSSVPSLTITGSRGSGAERNIIRVRGASTELAGELVTLWLSLSGRPATPAPSTAKIKADGTFTWARKLNRAAVIYAEVGTMRSNTITMPARHTHGASQL